MGLAGPPRDQAMGRYKRGVAMDGFCLTDWCTIFTSGSTAQLAATTQPSARYLDLGPHEDAVFYLDVREVSNPIYLAYQTSPSADDASFVNLVGPFQVVQGTRVDSVLAKYAFAPIARYVRWQLAVDPQHASLTFRIWVAAS
jgi:hypothetical protein